MNRLKAAVIFVFIGTLSACQPEVEQLSKNKPMHSGFAQQFGEPVNKHQGLSFPRDHGAHHQQGIEWWYVTANLKADNGDTFGVQWTLFRLSVDDQNTATETSPWWNGQLYFAHFAIQSDTQHHAFEKYGRSGQVNITVQPFEARLDDWQLVSKEATFLPLNLKAQQENYSANLVLANSPLVKHGERGYSQKTHQGHASYYYSYPFLQAKGNITFAGETYKVTGDAWLDREWSSALIDPSQNGWDWFSIQADDKKQGGLMAFCIRNGQQIYDYCSASHITSGGVVRAIANNDVTLQVLKTSELTTQTAQTTPSNKTYPIKWQLNVEGFEPITIEARNPDSRNQLSIPYWEGRIKTQGGFKGKGYAELVGY
ncbi:MAG: ABC transporter [Colwellia sp.]|nr:ABC transporter [Colwellia sp.]